MRASVLAGDRRIVYVRGGIYSQGYSLIPHEFSLEAYQMAFKYPDRVLRAYGITVSITALGTFLSLLITSMCGYALQRDDFKSRGFFTMFVFFTMLFSGGLVPWYLLITNYLKLKDTYLILILTQLVNVFYVILMKNFMKTGSESADRGGEDRRCGRILYLLSHRAAAGKARARQHRNVHRAQLLERMANRNAVFAEFRSVPAAILPVSIAQQRGIPEKCHRCHEFGHLQSRSPAKA